MYRALLESVAAEHAARMTAMEAASSNAGDVIDKLTLVHEPRAPGEHHARDYRNCERRGRSGANSARIYYERNGKVIQVAGPAVDMEFPEGQIPVIRTAIRITSEGFNVPEPIDIICEVAQHIGESRVRTIALQPTDGLVRGMKADEPGRAGDGSGGQGNAGPRAERDRRAGGQDGSGEHRQALSDSSPGAGL